MPKKKAAPESSSDSDSGPEDVSRFFSNRQLDFV